MPLKDAAAKGPLPRTMRRLELFGLFAVTALLLAQPDLATLAAGIGLFLWGMSHLEEGVKRLSGGTLDRWLHRATQSPARAIGVGALATALVQSSSLITLLAMSFVSTGLISLALALGLNRLAEEPGAPDIGTPVQTVRHHWQHELAERLRQQRLDPWLASTLMNDLHQASRLMAALVDSPPASMN